MEYRKIQLLFVLLFGAGISQAQQFSKNWKRSLQHQQLKHKSRRYKRVIGRNIINDGDEGDHDDTDAPLSMSMEDVSCYVYQQPLDHFTPSSHGATFPQRYCIYDGYDIVDNSNNGQNPIFFYTGNESPIDEYVNNTGLIWELAAKSHFRALVVFAEHRFEGESIPDFSDESLFSFGNGSSGGANNGCFTYLTSTQALQDFAALLSHLNPDHLRPVIAFGGSYGGMLSSWMRMKYPSSIAGAIASSAPVFGFPKTLSGDITTSTNDSNMGFRDNIPNEGTMDGGSHVVGNGVKLPKPDTGRANEDVTDDAHRDNTTNHCFDNLLATWPLMQYYGQSIEGRKVLSNEFRLCQPLRDEDDVAQLLDWAQSPWFNLAEGDYPYKSSYIPYALGEGLHELPAWPLQEACHGSSGLSNNLNVTIEGDRENIQLQIFYGDGNENEADLVLKIDWDHINLERGDLKYQHKVPKRLFAAVRKSVAIWFNVTKSLDCFDVIPAINENENYYVDNNQMQKEMHQGWLRLGTSAVNREVKQSSIKTRPELCLEKLQNETVWNSLVCNENLNLIMTYAKGMNTNRDFYWPPSHDRNQHNYDDTVKNRMEVEDLYNSMCSDPNQIFGYPDKSTVDPYSTFLDDFYGGLRIGYHSNIVFSNGLLDPWSAAGVYGAPQTIDETMCSFNTKYGEKIDYKCDMLQNVTRDGTIVAVILDLGAHHLDLMPSDEKDPDCARIARRIEEHYILKWIDEWKEGQQFFGGGKSCDAISSDSKIIVDTSVKI